MLKLTRAAIAGLVALLLATLVSNLLFFQIGAPILFDPEIQSPKVIAVLFDMPPTPLMFTNGPLYMAITAVLGVLHGLIFALIEPALGGTRLLRGLGFALVVWVLMALYFEFHAPFNMFGEPASLVALELVFWGVVALVEGLVLSFLYGASRSA